MLSSKNILIGKYINTVGVIIAGIGLKPHVQCRDSSNDSEKSYSKKDIATLCNISKSTVYKIIKKNRELITLDIETNPFIM